MINQIFKVLILSIFLLTLVGCHDQATKTNNQEVADLTWLSLQNKTLAALRDKNYGEAIIHIDQLILNADKDVERWEYIRMALVSLPTDLALPLINKSLQLRFIKKNHEQLFGFSRVLTQIKQHDQALEVINTAIKKKRKPSYVYWRARLYLLVENEEMAEADYIWLINKEPQNIEYIEQYSTLLNYLNRVDEAIILLSSNENDPSLLFKQIVLHMQQGSDQIVKQKFNTLKELIEGKELNNTLNLQIGELAFWLEDYETSLTRLQKVNTGDDLNEAKLLMGRVLIQQNDYDRAGILFRQVQNGPEKHAIPAYLYEIESLREQGFVDEALQVANQSLQMFKNDHDLLYSRAMLYENTDDIPLLENDLMLILDQDPNNADALNALGYTWADRDMNLDQAYEYIMKAYEIKPDDKAILDSVGWVYYKKGELDQAEKYLRKAIHDNERDMESFKHLIVVLKSNGKEDEATVIEEKVKFLFNNSETEQ